MEVKVVITAEAIEAFVGHTEYGDTCATCPLATGTNELLRPEYHAEAADFLYIVRNGDRTDGGESEPSYQVDLPEEAHAFRSAVDAYYDDFTKPMPQPFEFPAEIPAVYLLDEVVARAGDVRRAA